MATFEQKIDVAGAYTDPAAIRKALESPLAQASAGEGVSALLKEHFLQLNAERHHPFAADGFYEQAAQLTGYTTDDGVPAVVVMKLGILLRWLGGVVTPTEKEYLAIPNYEHLEETYGRSPLEFSNLRVLFGRQKETGQIGPIGLVVDEEDQLKTAATAAEARGLKQKHVKTLRASAEAEAITGRGRIQGAGEVLYWLKLSTTHLPDDSVIPPLDELAEAGLRGVMEYLDQLNQITITE